MSAIIYILDILHSDKLKGRPHGRPFFLPYVSLFLALATVYGLVE